MIKFFREFHPHTLRIIALAIVLMLTILFFASQIDGYFSPRMLNRIATSVAVILPIAIGQAMVVISRNIDLSVGSIVGISAYLIGDYLGTHPDIHPVIVVGMALALGSLCGAINGALVAYGRVPSIIVTLGTLALFRTYLVEYSGARSITTSGLPEWLVDLPQRTIFSIGSFDMRLTVAMSLVAAIVFWVALRYASRACRIYVSGQVWQYYGCCWIRL